MQASASGRASLRVFLVLVTAGAIMSSCASSKPTIQPAASGTWPYPNGDLANTRNAPNSTISSANVSKLKQSWSFKLPGTNTCGQICGVQGYGFLAANPIVVDGVVYMQDLNSNVYALALASGNLKWEYEADAPETSGPGPNGVAVVAGTVYGTTPATVFALSAATGHKIWTDRNLLDKGQGAFGIQPQVANGRVYLASQYGSGPGGGVLLALDAATGAELWQFNTAIGPAPGVQAFGLGTGGAWETPLVGGDGTVTYGIGNPYQSVGSAIDQPAQLLYSDSDVNLDATTGKLRWYYQGVANDFKDYDMQTSPIAASVNGAPVIIGSGKMGVVYEMNAQTGKLLWKTPVGEHNGHDDDSQQALEGKSAVKLPLTFLPGSLGGVLTNLALAGQSIYVLACDIATTYTSLSQVSPSVSTTPTPVCEMEALSLATGAVEWDTKLAGLAFGAATVSNDLVFTVLYKGVLIALNRNTGAIVSRQQLPTSANAPIAIAGNTVIVPAGGPTTSNGGGDPQVVAYTAP